MEEADIFCRVCLEENRNNFSIYLHVQEKYLPSVIENISGVLISSLDEPDAHICKECALAIIRADEIILKCQKSNKFLAEQQNVSKTIEDDFEKQLELKNEAELERNAQHRHMNENTTDLQYFGKYEINDAATEFNMHLLPRPTLGLSLSDNFPEIKQEAQDQDSMDDSLYLEPEMFVESILEIPETTNNNTSEATQANFTPATQPSMYFSTTKCTKPKKKYVRSREQYLKRKIRNLPMKEPLTLIGGAGVVRKRKPKSFHRVIPNFYFKCELCHEFESNVASYSITHLNKVHHIDRPAIFKCRFCDTKPFIKNQSLQEHISTIHEQQPKVRAYQCTECGKSFIKNCHLQKHLMSVHKRGLLPLKCEQVKYKKSHMDHFALKLRMKQMQNSDQPYACDLCGQRFAVMYGLNTHMQTMHPMKS